MIYLRLNKVYIELEYKLFVRDQKVLRGSDC